MRNFCLAKTSPIKVSTRLSNYKILYQKLSIHNTLAVNEYGLNYQKIATIFGYQEHTSTNNNYYTYHF